MTLKAQPRLLRGHSAAVVDNLDECLAGILYEHGYTGSPGIHRVLYQFLDNRGRSLDHLSGRNKIGNVGGKYLEHPERLSHGFHEYREILREIDQKREEYRHGHQSDYAGQVLADGSPAVVAGLLLKLSAYVHTRLVGVVLPLLALTESLLPESLVADLLAVLLPLVVVPGLIMKNPVGRCLEKTYIHLENTLPMTKLHKIRGVPIKNGQIHIMTVNLSAVLLMPSGFGGEQGSRTLDLLLARQAL